MPQSTLPTTSLTLKLPAGEQPASRSSKDCNAVSFRSRFVLGEHFTTFKPNIKDLLVTVRIGTYDNIV